MAGETQVEARLRVLEDIEALKKLKARYWRYIDNKMWQELADCFDEEPFAEYLGPENQFRSVADIVAYLKGDPERFETTAYHHGHNPDIEITRDDRAKGVWAFYVNINMSGKRSSSSVTMAGFYEDEYVKRGGAWRIKKTVARATAMETANK